MSIGTLDGDFLNESFSLFDLSIPDCDIDDFVLKANDIARRYKLKNDDMADELVAFAANVKRETLDTDSLEQFEQHLIKKQTKQETQSVVKKRKVLGELKVADLPFDFGDDNESFIEEKSCAPPAKKSLLSIDTPAKYAAFAPVPPADGSTWFTGRREAGRTISGYGEFNKTKQGNRLESVDVHVLYGEADPAGKGPCYSDEKTAVSVDALSSLIERYARSIAESNPDTVTECNGFTSFCDLIEQEDVLICGQVRSEEGEGLSSSDVHLVGEDGGNLHVDLSGLVQCYLFPGQILAVRGRLVNEGVFVGTELLHANPPPTASVKRGKGDLVVWAAAGPYTSVSTASYEPLAELLALVKTELPDVLILIGPFIDRGNLLQTSADATLTDDALMTSLMKKIFLELAGVPITVCLVASSYKDAVAIPVFPGQPWRTKLSDVLPKKNPNVLLLTDPCTLNIEGVEMAITASEIFVQLRKREVAFGERKENTDVLARTGKHLVEQRSLYPLHPPALPASTQLVFNECSFDKCLKGRSPHLLIAPCVLNPLVKQLAPSTLLINPSTMVRSLCAAGTFAKMRIALSQLPKEENTEALADFVHVDFVKI